MSDNSPNDDNSEGNRGSWQQRRDQGSNQSDYIEEEDDIEEDQNAFLFKWVEDKVEKQAFKDPMAMGAFNHEDAPTVDVDFPKRRPNL